MPEGSGIRFSTVLKEKQKQKQSTKNPKIYTQESFPLEMKARQTHFQKNKSYENLSLSNLSYKKC
jgi:ribosome assembly protein YihI (activator of Der GTPase)